MSKNFSHIDVHKVAREALRNYGFSVGFPPPVLKEAHKLKDHFPNGEFEKSFEDLRSFLWSSIDNIDSEDLDQLEYCELAPRNEIHVYIAIADVDSYVAKGSAIDRQAFTNGTTVYAEVDIFPMLPVKLCNNFSSLVEGKDRLGVVVDFFVLKNGDLKPGHIRQAIVKNKAKLVYESVGDWLEMKGSMPEKIAQIKGLKEQMFLQFEAAQRLHEFRMENGALELETFETSVVAASDGHVKDIVLRSKNLARMIIENFMIGANRTMSAFLDKYNIPYIQRILRRPEHWNRLVELAFSLRDDLPDEPDSKALSNFLVRQRKRDEKRFPDLSLAVVKLLGHAEYDIIMPNTKKQGHFGLALHDYTHSTAPNRRYVDIILQRLVKAMLKKQPSPYGIAELVKISGWCTERDQTSKKVERFMVKVAGAVLMKDKLGQIFEALVTGVSEKGTYVRLFSPPVEGRVMRNFIKMSVGNKVFVRLTHLEPTKGFIDFEGVVSKGR